MAEFIPKFDGSSLAGICDGRLEIARASTAIFAGEVVDHAHTVPCVLLSQAPWYDLYFTPGSLTFEESEIQVDGGQAFEAMLQGKLALDIPPRLVNIIRASRGGWVLKFTDNNGITRLMGHTEQPVAISLKKRGSGNEIGAFNGYELSARITMKAPVPSYPF